jgi:hypothetical protein
MLKWESKSKVSVVESKVKEVDPSCQPRYSNSMAVNEMVDKALGNYLVIGQEEHNLWHL